MPQFIERFALPEVIADWEQLFHAESRLPLRPTAAYYPSAPA
jgi:hypothetical protein